MNTSSTFGDRVANLSIWWFALGYFASYVPYSALTKAVSKGLVGEGAVPGSELVPVTVLVSVVGMVAFISLMGWWKYTHKVQVGPLSVPVPGVWTFLSGLCTATIILTTTLAYTFEGVSIVFAMLLMRGGVLVIAPVIDALTGRHVRWFSWAGLALSIAALFVAFSGDGSWALSTVATVDIVAYLASYFVRLRLMTRLAKSADGDANLRYFVEEQIVASPALLIATFSLAFLGDGATAAQLKAGFTTFFGREVALLGLLIGLCSWGTGVFGGLILLSRQENTYCVPVNRSSSVLAGVIASAGLTVFLGQAPPPPSELAGAGLIILAIVFLTLPTLLDRLHAPAPPRKAAPPVLPVTPSLHVKH